MSTNSLNRILQKVRLEKNSHGGEFRFNIQSSDRSEIEFSIDASLIEVILPKASI